MFSKYDAATARALRDAYDLAMIELSLRTDLKPGQRGKLAARIEANLKAAADAGIADTDRLREAAFREL